MSRPITVRSIESHPALTAEMLRTRPVVILPANAAHQDSYRPDLPLQSELLGTPEEVAHAAELEAVEESAREVGYDSGRRDGLVEGREERAKEVRELEKANAALRAQLAAKAS